MASGTLFVVATPIGNLEDITLRALRTLREVDLIAAEDTRHTAKLLSHYDIHRPVTSLHAHNEWREADRLVRELQAGRTIALVTDAGTPGIADPGAILVERSRTAGIRVVPVPGPSAVMAALSVAGQGASQFSFAGFPPRGGQERETWFEAISKDPRVVVFFEAPHRIALTVKTCREYMPCRIITAFRELTKINEELIVWPNNTPNSVPTEKGEFVVVVSADISKEMSSDERDDTSSRAADLFGCLTTKCQFDEPTALALAARGFGLPEASLTKSLKKRRIAQKQAQQRRS